VHPVSSDARWYPKLPQSSGPRVRANVLSAADSQKAARTCLRKQSIDILPLIPPIAAAFYQPEIFILSSVSHVPSIYSDGNGETLPTSPPDYRYAAYIHKEHPVRLYSAEPLGLAAETGQMTLALLTQDSARRLAQLILVGVQLVEPACRLVRSR
jgi:hypothetical protein